MVDLGLDGRVAVVTGASAGIGREISLELAAEGVTVLALARRIDALDAMAAAGRIVPVPGDVTDRELPARVVGQARADYGRLDIVVNCAGGSRPLPVDAEEERWVEGMELNFFSVRRLSHAALDLMTERGYGRILTLSGSSEPMRYPVYQGDGVSALNAANSATGAVHAWAKGLSREVGKQGITVNSIAPSSVASEQLGRIFPTAESKQEHIDEHIPVGRFGRPEDVAGLAVFLASSRAGYISGEVFHVDGGKRRFAY